MKNIKTLFKNELMRKIIIFFNENPHCIDTPNGISVWVGCDVEEAKKSLNMLAKDGLLVRHKTPSTEAYSYTTNKKIVKKVEKYIKDML